MGLFSGLFRKEGSPAQPKLTSEELMEKLKICQEQDLPVHHRFHGDLRVTRVQSDRFYADSDIRTGLMFQYKYFSDGLLTLPPEVL